MADNVKTLRRRLRSIRNMGQITRAMEMVSAAKLRRAQDALMAGRPYGTRLREILGRLAASGNVEHPLFEIRPVRRRLIVVVTSDRGLAGAFNAQIIRFTEAMLRDDGAENLLACVGRKGYDHFKTRSWHIVSHRADAAGRLSAARSKSVTDSLIDPYVSGQFDEIVLVYNAFVSTLTYRQTAETLLPLDPVEILGRETASGPLVDYKLEPDSRTLLDSLLPRYVGSRVYMALAESLAAEHSARMVAMGNATRNCEELIGSVSLRMNKLRQAGITKEILEIVGGAEALKG